MKINNKIIKIQTLIAGSKRRQIITREIDQTIIILTQHILIMLPVKKSITR